MKTISTFLLILILALSAQAQKAGDDASHEEAADLAFHYKQQGKYEQAIPYLKRLVEHLREKQDVTWLVELGQLAALHLLANQYSEAIRLYDLQWEQKEKHPKLPDTITAMIYSQQAIPFEYFGNRDSDSISMLSNRALRLFQRHLPSTHHKVLTTKLRLANFYLRSYKYKQAEDLLDEIISLARKDANSSVKVLPDALRTLALHHYTQKHFEKAAKYYQESIQLVKQLSEPSMSDLTFAQNGLALAYIGQGKPKKAISIYQELNALWKDSWGEEHPEYAVGLYNLAYAYEANGNLDSFEALSEKALAIFRKKLGVQHYRYISALKTMGVTYLRLKQYETALSFLQKALGYNCMAALDSLPEDISELHQYEFKYQGLAITTLKNYFSMMANLYFLKDKDPDYLLQSYQSLKLLLKVQAKQLESFTQEEDKFSSLQSIYTYADYALDLADRIDDKKYHKETFEFAELNKSAILKGALRGSQQYQLGKISAEIYEQEKALRLRRSILNKEATASIADAAEWLQKSNQLNQEIEQFKQKLKEEQPAYFKKRYETKVPPLEAFQTKLKEGQLMLVYYYGIRSLFIYSIDKDSFHFHKQVMNMDSLEYHIRQLREALTNYNRLQIQRGHIDSIYIKSAHWLYKKVLLPGMPKDKSYQQLILVPDGSLAHIPFEALLRSKPDKELSYKDLDYLLRHYEISYNYSASLWYDYLDTEREENTKGLMAWAATYAESDAAAERKRGFRAYLKELPGAEEEVKLLEKAYAGSFEVGLTCNEGQFKKVAKDYTILHLAMHGLLNKEYPLLSGLAFTDTKDTIEDDFLQAWEISQLDLRAELVVLSACETGYGKFRQGEGLMSLARSFMYAGVPAQLVSLWPVNDRSTSSIMQNFYGQLDKGKNKAAALQQAKLDYMAEVKNELTAHPVFWAPFIQLGDSRPIEVSPEGENNWLWWLMAALLLIATAAIALWRNSRRA